MAVGAVADAESGEEGTRRSEGEREDDQHPQHHEQQIADAQRAAVLRFGAQEIARGGKVDARGDVPPQQVQQQRHADRGAEHEPERREKAHVRRSRAPNASRSGME